MDEYSSFKIPKFEYLSEPTAKRKRSFKWNWNFETDK